MGTPSSQYCPSPAPVVDDVQVIVPVHWFEQDAPPQEGDRAVCGAVAIPSPLPEGFVVEGVCPACAEWLDQ